MKEIEDMTSEASRIYEDIYALRDRYEKLWFKAAEKYKKEPIVLKRFIELLSKADYVIFMASEFSTSANILKSYLTRK